MSWETKIENKLWVNYNFLDDAFIDKALNFINKSETIEITQSISHYQAHRNFMRSNSKFTGPILGKLNEQYKILFNKVTNTQAPSSLQFVSKKFVPNLSFYKVHKENPDYYGDSVFMFYLTDEIDGDLVIPEYNINITPKRNLCVIMRTGFDHLVEKCSGERICITGWSFAGGSHLTKNLRKHYDVL